MQYVRLFQRVLGVDELFLKRKPVPFAEEWLRQRLERHLRKLEADPVLRDVPRLGLMVGLGNSPKSPCELGVFVTFGTAPGSAFVADPSGVSLPSTFMQSTPGAYEKVRQILIEGIEIMGPFYAGAEDSRNCERMGAYELGRRVPARARPGGFPEPVLIHGLTYLRSDLVRALGGRDHVIRVPSYSAVEFGNGVLIELVDGPFDDTNPAHRDLQERAMAYLGIPTLALVAYHVQRH